MPWIVAMMDALDSSNDDALRTLRFDALDSSNDGCLG